MSQKENDKKYLLKSLNKALKVLDIITVREELTLTEICSITGLDKTSAFKILYTLERRGFVLKTPDLHYRVGDKIAHYDNRRSERKNIVDVATEPIHSLCVSTKETVSLAILNSNGRSINIYVEVGSSADHVPSRIGMELDAYSVPVGKVLLAYTSPQIVQTILQSAPLRAYTSSTISTAAQLYQVLDEVRTQGYCADSNQRYDGRSSLAAPIFDHNGECIAAVALVCTTETFLQKQELFLEKIRLTAARISADMGYIDAQESEY